MNRPISVSYTHLDVYKRQVYEPVPPVDGQYLGYPVYDEGAIVLLVVNFAESMIYICLLYTSLGNKTALNEIG